MDLSSLGAHSAGIWTRREALARLSRARVAAMLREGYWQSPLPGIYADGGTVLDPEQRAYAAVLASGEGAVAAGRTAARVFGLPLIDDDDPATDAYDLVNDDVAAASSRSAGAAAGNVHRRQGALPPGDVLRRRSGLLVTSPARTLFDCAGLLTYEALLCATDDALHRGLVTPGELAATAARQAWQRGAPAFRTTVRAADGRSESPAESLARLLLRSELPGLQPQIELWDTAVRLLARFDLADKAVRFAVEVDRKRGHAGAAMVNRDRRRDRRSDRLGWTTERVTWFELRREPSQTLRRVVEQIAYIWRGSDDLSVRTFRLRHAGRVAAQPSGQTEDHDRDGADAAERGGADGQSSWLRRWTFCSNPIAIMLANIADPP